MLSEEEKKALISAISSSADAIFSQKVKQQKYDSNNNYENSTDYATEFENDYTSGWEDTESFDDTSNTSDLNTFYEDDYKTDYDSSKSTSDNYSNVIQFPTSYTGETEDIKKACEDLRSKDELLSDWKDEVIKNILPYAMKEVEDARKKAYKSKESNKQAESKIAYKRDTCMVNGESLEFTRVMQIPDWGIDLQECLSNDDRARNFDQIRTKITQCLYDYYGGFTRFNTIVVSSYQLIINGSCYMPKLSPAILDKFPFDTVDYIKNGCIAPFLDWGYLSKMKNLSLLSFDDVGFVTSYVASDLNLGRDFEPLDLFAICKSLRTLEIGSDVITYPFDEDSESVRNVKTAVKDYTMIDKVYDGYVDKVCGTFGNVRKWTVNNLVNYANNRNNKNIFMYSGGILCRGIVSGIAGVAELNTRITGGIVKGLAHIVKGAVDNARSKD